MVNKKTICQLSEFLVYLINSKHLYLLKISSYYCKRNSLVGTHCLGSTKLVENVFENCNDCSRKTEKLTFCGEITERST